MIRVIVDSGSSIKQNEKELYNVEIVPLKILLGDNEYQDGIDITDEIFWDYLINKKKFPKTSLPSMTELEEKVNAFLSSGDEVIIVTISSGISGTYNAFRMMYEDNPKVRVIDSLSCVGGIKIIVNEINKYRNESLDFVVNKVNKLIPRIKILAVPETLEYLHRGGRLSKVGFIVGTLLHVTPIITIEKGHVKVYQKIRGLQKAMKTIVAELENCDENYPIVPSYTYQTNNLEVLKSKTQKKHLDILTEFDHLDYAVASHWGPNAFGYIFVEKE